MFIQNVNVLRSLTQKEMKIEQVYLLLRYPIPIYKSINWSIITTIPSSEDIDLRCSLPLCEEEASLPFSANIFNDMTKKFVPRQQTLLIFVQIQFILASSNSLI